jgi:hypothetical protein
MDEFDTVDADDLDDHDLDDHRVDDDLVVNAEAQEPATDGYLGYSYTVEGTSESGNDVAWSTSDNTYYDEKTWEPVEPT